MPLDADDCLNTNVDFDKFGTYMDNGVNILSKNQKVAFVHGLSMMFDKFNGFTISAYPVTVDLILQKHHAQTHIIYRKKDAIMAGAYDINIKNRKKYLYSQNTFISNTNQTRNSNHEKDSNIPVFHIHISLQCKDICTG